MGNKKNKEKNKYMNGGVSAEEEDEEEEEEAVVAPKKAKPTSTNGAPQEQDLLSDLFGSSNGGSTSTNQSGIELTQDKAKLVKLLLSPSGVLFENEMIQIGFRSQVEIPGGVMKILLYFGNKSMSDISVKSVECSNK